MYYIIVLTLTALIGGALISLLIRDNKIDKEIQSYIASLEYENDRLENIVKTLTNKEVKQ